MIFAFSTFSTDRNCSFKFPHSHIDNWQAYFTLSNDDEIKTESLKHRRLKSSRVVAELCGVELYE